MFFEHQLDLFGKLAYVSYMWTMTSLLLLVHGQVTIISLCLSVCLFVCQFVCAEYLSGVFDPICIKLGHMLHVRV